MSNLKINKIEVYNFKKFAHKTFDFNGSDICVLDGPNGFGKTTLYDAIELLLTGRIRRYEHLSRELLDARWRDSNNPLANDISKGCVYVKGELVLGDKTLYLMRKAPIVNIKNDNGVSFDYYKKYKLKAFEDLQGEEFNGLTEWLGKDYKRNFEFLHYIEQEDNIRMLKCKGANRSGQISHLTNTEKYGAELTKISTIRKKLNECIKNYERDRIKQLDTDIKQKSKSIAVSKAVIKHFKLFPDKSIEWDAENFKGSVEFFDSFLSMEGDFELLKAFSTYRDDYRKFCLDRAIIELKRKESKLSDFLDYYSEIESLPALQTKRKIILTANNALKLVGNTTTTFFENEESDIETLIRYLDDSIKGSFVSEYRTIKSMLRTASGVSKSISEFLQLRSNLIAQHKNLPEQSSNCPLCGYNWNEQQKLIESIEEKTKDLKNISEAQASDLDKKISNFKDYYITTLIKNINAEIKSNEYDIQLLSKLEGISKLDMKEIESSLKFIGVKFDDLLRQEYNIAELYRRIESFDVSYESDKVSSRFDQIFSDYCNKDWSEVPRFPDIELIEKKGQYLKWQRNNLLNEEIVRLKIEYDKSGARKDALNKQLDRIKQIEKQYEDALLSYNNTMIDSVEILFHIYSGRILQTSPSCLGLFIHNDKKKGLQFLNNLQDNCDAIFTMSSGQLSALIIAFTMSLNKIYSKNNLLFIDDPVQTMDDINILSFIEVLRNDFAGSQIFISTHEKRMSDLIRYKFAAFSKKTLPINIKES